MDKSETALSYFGNNYNCAQSVLIAFADEFGLPEDEALRIACAFGGGIGRQQLTCGALTGAAMAIGLKFGKGKLDDDSKKLLTYEKTVELFHEFEKLNGSTSCLELLENLSMNDEKDHDIILERELFTKKCRKYVANSVTLVEKIIDSKT